MTIDRNSASQEISLDKELTIISVFFNRASSVQISVASVLEQLRSNWQLVLVDDGSIDETLSKLKTYQASNVTVIGGPNIGLVNHFFREFQIAQSPYIALHGAGDVSLPGRFEKQLALLKSDKTLGFVSCFYQKQTEDGKNLSFHKPQPRKSNERLISHGLSQGEIMYRTSAYHEAGGYNRFFVVGQGTPLWKRILDAGYGLGVCEETLYIQRIFGNGVSKDRERIRLRAILSAIEKDAEIEKKKSGFDFLQSYGIHAPIFISVNRNLNKAFFSHLVLSYINGNSEDQHVVIFRRAALKNTHGLWKLACYLFYFTPLKEQILNSSFMKSNLLKKFFFSLGRPE